MVSPSSFEDDPKQRVLWLVQDEKRLVRPTLRCLLDEFSHEVRPDRLRVALRTFVDDQEDDRNFLLPCPLVDASHPVLDKANLIATDENAVHERIKAIADRHLIKVKTGDRRGALWQDEDGTWWLLAAGRRKDDGKGDFYQELGHLSADSSPITPTEGDRRYQLLETAYIAECAAERTTQAEMISSLIEAASASRTHTRLDLFGSTISMTLTPDEEGISILEVAWRFDRYDEQDRFPEDILALIPGHENINDWQFSPPAPGCTSGAAWFTYVPQSWVEELAIARELEDLPDHDTAAGPINLTTDGSEHFSHLAKKSVVTAAYATGIEIIGLCGARVVAYRDFQQFPTCPRCFENLRLLRQLKRSGGP